MVEFGVASRTDVAKITLKSAPDRPGVGARVFGALWSYDINVELVSSTSGIEEGQDITLVVGKDHLNPAILKLNKIKEEIEAKDLLVDHDVAIISVTLSGISNTPGVGARIFSALSKADINVEAVCSSTNAVSCVVREKDAPRAEEALRQELAGQV
jgi:aspartate kinase